MRRTNHRAFLAQEVPYQKSMLARILRVTISWFSNYIPKSSHFLGIFGMLGNVTAGVVELFPGRLFHDVFYPLGSPNREPKGF